jgi:hypothetical protein
MVPLFRGEFSTHKTQNLVADAVHPVLIGELASLLLTLVSQVLNPILSAQAVSSANVSENKKPLLKSRLGLDAKIFFFSDFSPAKVEKLVAENASPLSLKWDRLRIDRFRAMINEFMNRVFPDIGMSLGVFRQTRKHLVDHLAQIATVSVRFN